VRGFVAAFGCAGFGSVWFCAGFGSVWFCAGFGSVWFCAGFGSVWFCAVAIVIPTTATVTIPSMDVALGNQERIRVMSFLLNSGGE
jgi:hypothetical protein